MNGAGVTGDRVVRRVLGGHGDDERRAGGDAGRRGEDQCQIGGRVDGERIGGVDPRLPFVGDPKVNVNVLEVVADWFLLSVPVMVPEVCPAGITSGLAVTLLKSVPTTAVPPNVKGMVVAALETFDRLTLMLKVPAPALSVSAAVAKITLGGGSVS